MENLLKGYNIRGFSKGQTVSAILISKDKRSALFDVGGKSDAILSENYFDEAKSFVSQLTPGGKVVATVIEPETKDGRILISLRNSAMEALWERLENARKKNTPVDVVGKALIGKGMTVDVESLVGFIPSSQFGKKVVKNLESLIGKHFKVKVVELDKESSRVLLSEKQVSEEKELLMIKKVLSKIKVGEVYDGVVKQVTGFGAFVEIEVGKKSQKKLKIEGLVHVSEISWEKVGEPQTVLSEGDKVKVKVIDVGDSKLALSIKQTREDPWEKVEEKYKPDTKVKGEIVRVSDFGVFVQLEPGVEGLVHITKIPPATKLKVRDKVNCYVEEVDKKEKRISLGLVLTAKPVGYK